MYSAKEICRFMAKSADLAIQALKRLGRYLKTHPRMVFSLPFQTASTIEVYSDTDWAGCVDAQVHIGRVHDDRITCDQMLVIHPGESSPEQRRG